MPGLRGCRKSAGRACRLAPGFAGRLAPGSARAHIERRSTAPEVFLAAGGSAAHLGGADSTRAGLGQKNPESEMAAARKIGEAAAQFLCECRFPALDGLLAGLVSAKLRRAWCRAAAKTSSAGSDAIARCTHHSGVARGVLVRGDRHGSDSPDSEDWRFSSAEPVLHDGWSPELLAPGSWPHLQGLLRRGSIHQLFGSWRG
mmetsp:Transcript_98296/g.188626  ORF Transcript_98296/g.188626 Transcript_98296/m.188626 type:complete len:201 (+) Transcript_98296:1074-1676(+)